MVEMNELIVKKRKGLALTTEEIHYLINGYVQGRIPDYQVSAWLMAVCLRGMEASEMVDLTAAIIASGDRIDLSGIEGPKIDKHSTGGVGDKTTLIVAPLVAAAGVKVAKMSGRGLGHTGGTIDKLEAIPGFRTALTHQQLLAQVSTTGLAVVAQTENFTPADKKLYALRDVTGTVDSIPLIASSVMSKKIASGCDGVVLDVKTGSGAFMPKVEEALSLARAMVMIGKAHHLRTRALITNMDQPLGQAVGNALEVSEAIAVLKNEGPPDLRELCLLIASHMLVLAGIDDRPDTAVLRLSKLLANGQALERFRAWITAQDGDPSVIDDPERLPQAKDHMVVKAGASGFIQSINAGQVGRAAMLLGAGRKTKEAAVDPAVGVILRKKVGQSVTRGEPLAQIFFNSPDHIDTSATLIRNAISVGVQEPAAKPLLYHIVGDEETPVVNR